MSDGVLLGSKKVGWINVSGLGDYARGGLGSDSGSTKAIECDLSRPGIGWTTAIGGKAEFRVLQLPTGIQPNEFKIWSAIENVSGHHSAHVVFFLFQRPEEAVADNTKTVFRGGVLDPVATQLHTLIHRLIEFQEEWLGIPHEFFRNFKRVEVFVNDGFQLHLRIHPRL